MPRYVILQHEMPTSVRGSVHWDLMLETAGVLRTWALTSEPARGVEIAANALPDHRLDYLHYEGPISGNRGTVHRWDEGQFGVLHELADELSIELKGKRLSGVVLLRKQSNNDQRWVFNLSFDKQLPPKAKFED